MIPLCSAPVLGRGKERWRGGAEGEGRATEVEEGGKKGGRGRGMRGRVITHDGNDDIWRGIQRDGMASSVAYVGNWRGRRGCCWG